MLPKIFFLQNMVKFHRSFCAQKLSFFGEVWYSGTEVENSVPHPSYEETDIKKSRDRKLKKLLNNCEPAGTLSRKLMVG